MRLESSEERPLALGLALGNQAPPGISLPSYYRDYSLITIASYVSTLVVDIISLLAVSITSTTTVLQEQHEEGLINPSFPFSPKTVGQLQSVGKTWRELNSRTWRESALKDKNERVRGTKGRFYLHRSEIRPVGA